MRTARPKVTNVYWRNGIAYGRFRVDGRLIRISVPPLSAEVRRKMVARIKELAEEAKVSIRNIRRDANKAADQAEKNKELSEDERDDLKHDTQELTKEHEAKVNQLSKTRETDVMDE